jgi:hypothetical protein
MHPPRAYATFRACDPRRKWCLVAWRIGHMAVGLACQHEVVFVTNPLPTEPLGS